MISADGRVKIVDFGLVCRCVCVCVGACICVVLCCVMFRVTPQYVEEEAHSVPPWGRPSDLVSGQNLKSKYHTVGQAGKGGFGSVWRAKYHDKVYAIKVSKPTKSSEEHQVLTEIATLNACRHESIPLFYEAFRVLLEHTHTHAHNRHNTSNTQVPHTPHVQRLRQWSQVWWKWK